MKSYIFFNLPNTSSRTMGLGVYSASKSDEHQTVSLGDKAWPVSKADILTSIYKPIF
jgi:hypothetical protein